MSYKIAELMTSITNNSKQEIDKVVKDTVKRIKELSKELALEYTIEIDEEDFMNKLQDYSIDKAFVSKFGLLIILRSGHRKEIL